MTPHHPPHHPPRHAPRHTPLPVTPVDVDTRAHLATPGKYSRREFIRRSAMLAGVGVAAPFALDLAGLTAASGARADGSYRALVCVFLFGGNDHNDTFVPCDVASYDAYLAVRNAISRDRNSLLSLDPLDGFNDGRAVAFVPEFANLKRLFDAQDLALVSNIGTLLAPISKAEYQAGTNRPPQLFSHNDQQSLWQSSAPEGARTGWGGRMADLLLDSNGSDSVFTCMSLAGNAVMMSGRDAVQYQVDPRGVTRLNTRFSSNEVLAGLEEVMRLDGDGMFPRSYSGITQRALDSSDRLTGALSGTVDATFPASRLGSQLAMVAKLIQAGRDTLGVKRQVFFVAAGGFDNHDGLAEDHPALLADIDASLSAFHSATTAVGATDEVTTFTASDFGRTLVGNGNGSDHGWGSHHIVMGGAVRGKRNYGRLPIVADDGPDDVGRGRLLPTTAVEQYASTFAKWMGVTGSELDVVSPSIGRFATDDLGFFEPETIPDDDPGGGGGGGVGGGSDDSPVVLGGVRSDGLAPAKRLPN